MTINERLKAARQALGLTQTELATRLGFATSTITNMEQGQRQVGDRHVHLMNVMFNVNENWFRTGEGEMFAPDDSLIAEFQKRFALTEADAKMVTTILTAKPADREKIFAAVKILAELFK